MRYLVGVMSINPQEEIELDEEAFIKLREARNCLSASLAIEEKFEILLSNYLDLEKECLNISSEYMVRNATDYSDFFDVILAFDRRMINLLTSTKLYIDQIQQHVRACQLTDDEIKENIVSLFSNEYDNYFEYRFMEALRNYVQHRGLAVHSAPMKAQLTSQNLIEYTTKILTHRSKIAGDKAFKRQVYNEMPEEVDLLHSTKVYIGSLSKVHSKIRLLIDQEVKNSRAMLSDLTNKYGKINNGDTLGLAALCYPDDNPSSDFIEMIPLLLDWDDIRENLIRKNSSIENLGLRYVSGNAYNKANAHGKI